MIPTRPTSTPCGRVAGFLAAFVLPAGTPAVSIAVIVILAELAFVLDCADGLLARVTGKATPFGDLLDHTLDIASQSFALGAIFVYAHRAGLAEQDFGLAGAALAIGFLFLVARSTRQAEPGQRRRRQSSSFWWPWRSSPG